MASKVVHTVLPIEHPDRPWSLFADVPLFCGKAKTYETHTTHSADHVTCKRCQKLLQAFNEDLEYRRTMAKLENQRQQVA